MQKIVIEAYYSMVSINILNKQMNINLRMKHIERFFVMLKILLNINYREL